MAQIALRIRDSLNKVALPRSGRILQRSRDRFDSPVAPDAQKSPIDFPSYPSAH